VVITTLCQYCVSSNIYIYIFKNNEYFLLDLVKIFITNFASHPIIAIANFQKMLVMTVATLGKPEAGMFI
jgi:hypothetical protein